MGIGSENSMCQLKVWQVLGTKRCSVQLEAQLKLSSWEVGTG